MRIAVIDAGVDINHGNAGGGFSGDLSPGQFGGAQAKDEFYATAGQDALRTHVPWRPFAGPKLQILIVGNASELVVIVGGPTFGMSDPAHGATYLVGND